MNDTSALGFAKTYVGPIGFLEDLASDPNVFYEALSFLAFN